MAKFAFTKGSTSIILIVFIQDSSATDGSGLSGLDQTSSIVGGYVRQNGTGVALAVDEDVTTEGTYQAPSTVAHVRIGTPANMRTGTYELHFHNTLFVSAAGVDYVTITLGGAANMAELAIEVQLTGMDFSDSVRGGMTALPNAAADAAGGLPISDTGGLDLDALDSNVSAILTDTGTTLDNHLTDIKGTGFVKDTHSLVNIEGYVDLIDDGTSGLAKIATDVAAVLVDTGTTIPAVLGAPSNLGSGATLAANNADMAGATFATGTDSLEALRNRGDSAWITATTVDLNADQSGVTIGTVNALTGHTAQTADHTANIAAILTDTGTDGVVIAAATQQNIAATMLDLAAGVETGITLRQGLRVILAACAGKSDGLDTSTAHYRDQADTLNRITASVDADGNRSSVTLDTT